MRRACFTAIILLAHSACTPPAPSGLSAMDTDFIRGMDAAFVDAVTNADWTELAGLYEADAVLMPPNAAAIKGATAIGEWFANTGLAIEDFTTEVTGITGEAGFAGIGGTYQMVFFVPPAGAVVTDRGKFLWIVRKGSDGAWRITTDIWNSSEPLPQTP